MASKNDKNKDNIEGVFYVDSQCIACDVCVAEAPKNFSMNDIQGHAFVKLQPKSENDLKNCSNAMDLCPVNAIGNDGD